MSLLQDYISSIKNPKIEEFIDLVFFRPLAFILVKPLSYLPLTPNQISLMSCVAGVNAAFFFSLGTHSSFAYAACFYALYAILDCCDGMIARLKGTGSPLGRVVDGFVDYTVGITVYCGLAIGIARSSLDLQYSPWLLSILAGLSTVIHCVLFDFYLNKYLDSAAQREDSVTKDINKYSNELKNNTETTQEDQQPWYKLSLFLYVFYSKIQNLFQAESASVDPKEYCKKNEKTMRLWGLIGPDTHVVFLIIAAVLFKPMIFFFYTLVFGNLWFLFMMYLQHQTNKKLST